MADLVHSSLMIFGLITEPLTEPLPVKCRLNGGKANNYMQAVKDKDSGGFHLHLLVFLFVHQFNSRIRVPIHSSFAND